MPRPPSPKPKAAARPVEVAPPPATDLGELNFARRIIVEEASALSEMARRLDATFTRAVDSIVSCAEAGGNVLVTGLGKSGLIGSKISATFASLAIPSHSVHPSDAAHGDLGRFRPKDLVIAISYSGETAEVVNLAAILRQDGLKVISITGGVTTPAQAAAESLSSLEQLATIRLRLNVPDEAGGPEFVAPTNSTTAALALGDALALTAARRRNFTHQDFAKRHPGGALGGLLRPVTDVMRWTAGKNLPLIDSRLTVREALERASGSGRRPGAIVLVNAKSGSLAGIFTDADLRRLVLKDADDLSRPVEEVMTRSPHTLASDALIRDAVTLYREHRHDEIPIIDAEGRPVGLLDVQDLIAQRLVQE